MWRSSLQTKLITIFVLIMLFMIGLLLLNQRWVLIPIFAHLEEEFAARDIDRVVQAIEQEKKGLDSILFDWSAWDETYDYAKQPNSVYVDGNLDPQSLSNINLNLLYIFNRKDELVWGRGIDLEHKVWFDFGEFPNKSDPVALSLLHFSYPDSAGSVHSGLLQTSQGLLLVASRPILTSKREGPATGILVMGRILSGHILEQLQKVTGAEFSIFPRSEISSPAIAKALTPVTGSSSQALFVDRTDDDHLVAYRTITDLGGNASLVIRSVSSREIFRTGFATMQRSFWMVVAGLMLLMITLMLLGEYSVIRPIILLSKHLTKVRVSGNYNLPFEYQSKDELGRLAQRFNELLARVAEHSSQLQDLSYEDTLTQVANRRFFNDSLETIWNRALLSQQNVSVILCDIDCFKAYNDHLGHLPGDRCIRAVAQTVRRAANKKLDIVARYGGEEFVVILPDTSLEDAVHVAERIRREVEGLQLEHPSSLVGPVVTVSLGVATVCPTPRLLPEMLVKAADAALYRAKSAGRNCVEVAPTLGSSNPSQHSGER